MCLCSFVSTRYSLLATRKNIWAAGVCAEDGSELYVLGPKVVQGEASTYFVKRLT